MFGTVWQSDPGEDRDGRTPEYRCYKLRQSTIKHVDCIQHGHLIHDRDQSDNRTVIHDQSTKARAGLVITPAPETQHLYRKPPKQHRYICTLFLNRKIMCYNEMNYTVFEHISSCSE